MSLVITSHHVTHKRHCHCISCNKRTCIFYSSLICAHGFVFITLGFENALSAFTFETEMLTC